MQLANLAFLKLYSSHISSRFAPVRIEIVFAVEMQEVKRLFFSEKLTLESQLLIRT